MNFEFSEQQENLRQRVRKFANEKIAPKAEEWDNSYETCEEAVKLIREEGLFRLFFPPEYGGDGLSAVNICIAREELARVSMHAQEMFLTGGLGSGPLVLFGSEEQKKRYLPALARGEKFIVFCLSEPGAGSDIGAIETTAQLDGDYYILNGIKSYLQRPAWTDYYCVFAKTDPTQRTRGLSAFIVERGEEGPNFSIKKIRVSFPCDMGDITFTNYQVPKENLLGWEGQGARIALSNLDIFRVSVGAANIGLAQQAFDIAKNFAEKRIVFKQPLSNFQATQFKLAELATEMQAARLLIYMAAWKLDQKGEAIKEASMAKLFATEVAYHVVDEAVQILGARGVSVGQRVEYLFRAVRASRIYEGTSEIQKIVIARQVLAEDTFASLP